MFDSHFTFLRGEEHKNFGHTFCLIYGQRVCSWIRQQKAIKDMAKVKPVFALASWFVLFPGVSLGKYNDKDTIHRNKVWMDDEICTIFYHLHFQKWKGMTSIMLRKGFLRTRRHFQCSLSFHLSLSSDCYFDQNEIFLQLFDKCFSLVRSGNALQNLALWKVHPIIPPPPKI